MDKIWANRLIAGTKTWAEMPARRRPGVKRELAKRVAEGKSVKRIISASPGKTTTMDKLLELLEKLVRAIFGPGDKQDAEEAKPAPEPPEPPGQRL